MLTTIVCLVTLLGSHTPQRITLHLTPVNVSELRSEYPGQSTQTAVCSHLNRALQLGSEE